MAIQIDVQRIDESEIRVRDHGTFATVKIERRAGTVNLYLPDHDHAKLVAAALQNDRAAVCAWVAALPDAADDDERPDEPSPEEYRRMQSLYDAEKAAGLHKSREEYEAEMRDAGRGHLLGR